jgi:hypothetical protein
MEFEVMVVGAAPFRIKQVALELSVAALEKDLR